jgi:nucleoside-diphosphate-sugar epimerase
MHVSVLRFPLLYGRDNKGSLARLIAAVDAGWWPPLPAIRNRRSMVHVDDVVAALRLVSERPEANGKTYIVTVGQFYSTSDIDALIRVALGKGTPRWRIPVVVMRLGARVGDVIGKIRGREFTFNTDILGRLTESVCYSNEKIVVELGFRPTRTLAGGLQEMVGQSRILTGMSPNPRSA